MSVRSNRQPGSFYIFQIKCRSRNELETNASVEPPKRFGKSKGGGDQTNKRHSDRTRRDLSQTACI